MKGHGEVQFSWKKNALYVEAFGPFNEVAVAQVVVEYLEYVNGKNPDTFYVIEIWDEFSLGSPEVMMKVGQFWQYLMETSCLALCVVVKNGVQKRLCEKLLPSMGRVFLSTLEAEQWLLSKQ